MWPQGTNHHTPEVPVPRVKLCEKPTSTAMKFPTLFVFACLAAWAQTPPTTPPAGALPDLPDETVVAVFDDGVKFTMGDFKQILSILPAQNQQLAMQNRRMFVEQWALMRRLTQLAEKEKLDQRTPIKEQLLYNRMNLLSQAEINQSLNTLKVDPSEVEKYYEANKENYKRVRVKAIYVAFGGSGEGKKSLSEEQAKAKALKLLQEIRSGGDFLKLVKENSDDVTSREKDGDFATLRPKDNIPDAIRTAVFALKKGEVTEPVRQPNGFYLLRADDITYRPLTEVQDEIFTTVRQQHFGRWFEDQKNATKVQFPAPAFVGGSVTVPLPQLPPPPGK